MSRARLRLWNRSDDAADREGLQGNGTNHIFAVEPYIVDYAMKAMSCRISKSGRLSIPAAFRRAAGLEHGGNVIVELADREIRIRSVPEAVARAQAISKRLLAGKPDITVDEFIAERHREAER